MDGNSHKPHEFPVSQGLAVAALREWLRREGGNQKIPLVLELLCDKTTAALDRGEEPPSVEPDTLRDLYFATRGGTPSAGPASSWLLRRGVMSWWRERTRQIHQACVGTGWIPHLEVAEGGGRGNQSTYRLSFEPAGDVSAEPTVEMVIDPSVVQYEIEAAKGALWLRLLLSKGAFRMRSWRGYLLMGSVLATVLLLLVYWLLVLLVLNKERPMMASDFVLLAIAGFLTLVETKFWRPLWRLPMDRVTIASDAFLSISQMHGQFRLTRDSRNKLQGGWFNLVRHYANCPTCSGTVDLADGGVAFPGRIVGRCGDAPLEHVFSFDPVSLKGKLLR